MKSSPKPIRTFPLFKREGTILLKKTLSYGIAFLLIIEPLVSYASHNQHLDVELTNLNSSRLTFTSLEGEPSLLSQNAQDFLEHYQLSQKDLRERAISLKAFQALFDTDTSAFWNRARMVAINQVIPHALEAPFRGGRPIWPLGGMAPIKNPFKRTVPAFIDAFTSATYENLEHIFKLSILGFLIEDFRTTNSFSSAVSLLWGNEEHTVNHLLSFLQTRAGPYVVGIGLSLPVLWGIVHGVLSARHVRHDGMHQTAPYRTPSMLETSLLEGSNNSRFKGLADHLEAHPQTAWTHYGRPFLMGFVPFKADAIAEHLREMVAVLRWSGSVTAAEGRDIFRAARSLSYQRGIAGLMATDQLLEIMHGVNFKDFRYLLRKPGELTEEEQDRLLMYLEIKTNALTALKDLSSLQDQWRRRVSVLDGVERSLKGLYAKSLLWYGGESGSWRDPGAWATRGFMLGLKGVKTWLLVNLLTALGRSIVEFIACPNEFKDITQGDIGPISNTLGCFNEYVRIFNQIPGQPVETLTSLIPNVAFPNNQYQLDLSNKGIGNVTTIVEILNGFKENNVKLTRLDLSGNFEQTTSTQAYRVLGEAIAECDSLEALLFANNQLGFIAANVESFLGGLGKREKLSFLDLSWNAFETFVSAQSAGGAAILGRMFKNFPNLQHLDLNTNLFGSSSTNGTIAIATGLQQLLQLTYLDLSYTDLGRTGDAGLKALAESFSYISSLSSLNMHTNFIGFTGDEGATILMQGLNKLQNLTYLNLAETTIGYTGEGSTLALGNSLLGLDKMSHLILGDSDIGYLGDEGIINLSKALGNLRNLSFLDISGNYIGKTGDQGPFALASGLKGTPNLETFYFLPQGSYLSPAAINQLNQSLLSTKAGPLPLLLLTEEEVYNYIGSLPQDIRELNLSGIFSNPSKILLEALFQAIEKRSLSITKLILSNTAIGSTDTENTTALALGLKKLPGLTYLDLSRNAIGSVGSLGTKVLGASFSGTRNLTYLDISNNFIGNIDDEGTAALGTGLQYLPNLTYLNMSNIAMGYTADLGALALGQNLEYLSSLATLDLNANHIGFTASEGTGAIGRGLQFLTKLTYLDLGNNYLEWTADDGVVLLGESLKMLPSLTYLSFGPSLIGHKGDQGTVAIGKSLSSLNNLTSLDMSKSLIGCTGDEGTIAVGLGLKNKPRLTNLNLEDNCLGKYGSQGVELILENTIRSGLNLNLAGAAGISWSVGAEALATLNAGPVAAACYQQRCFSGNASQNVTSLQGNQTRHLLSLKEGRPVSNALATVAPWKQFSAGQRRTFSTALGGVREAIYKGLAHEVSEGESIGEHASSHKESEGGLGTGEDLGDEVEASTASGSLESLFPKEEPTPFFFTRWGRGIGEFVSGTWQATKDRAYTSWNAFGDWLVGKLTEAAHEVVTDSPSYFPNGSNPEVRDWGPHPSFYNITSSVGGGAALPPRLQPAPLP